MTRRTKTAPVLLASLLAGLLSACGVPPSGVIEVGEPATGMALANAVYFLDRTGRETAAAQPADGVVLRAVPRPEITGADPVASAVRRLLAGPTAAESDGLTTALPPDIRGSEVTVDTDRKTGDVMIRFPTGTPRLSGTALRQLSCTVELAASTGADRAPASGGGLVGPPQPAAPPVRITVTGTSGTADQAAPAVRACDF